MTILIVLVVVTVAVVGNLRTRARMVQAHADLRQITAAITLYEGDHHGDCPPTRASCSRQTGYALPMELIDYGLPRGRDAYGGDAVRLDDPFHPDSGYFYRAVGPMILNESTVIENGSTLWIPEGFPRSLDGEGKYHRVPRTSPVAYAVWSMGPEPTAAKFDIPGRLPVPEKYWMHGSGDAGVIVHIKENGGGMVKSH